MGLPRHIEEDIEKIIVLASLKKSHLAKLRLERLINDMALVFLGLGFLVGLMVALIISVVRFTW